MAPRRIVRLGLFHSPLLLFSGFATWGTAADAQAAQSPSIQGCIINGGSNTNVKQTCNFQLRFGLTPEMINNIVASVPRTKPVHLVAAGGPRGWDMGEDLEHALIAAGLQVTMERYGTVGGIDEPLTINTTGEQTIIILDSAV